jgi:hypothetical protein
VSENDFVHSLYPTPTKCSLNLRGIVLAFPVRDIRVTKYPCNSYSVFLMFDTKASCAWFPLESSLEFKRSIYQWVNEISGTIRTTAPSERQGLGRGTAVDR